jgi:hypothetical protein
VSPNKLSLNFQNQISSQRVYKELQSFKSTKARDKASTDRDFMSKKQATATVSFTGEAQQSGETPQSFYLQSAV